MRSAVRVGLGAALIVWCLSLLAEDKRPPRPTAEQIAQAIKDLSSPRYPVRQRASTTLFQAGAAAELALLEVVKAKADAEAVRRAAAILEQFKWGIYADTPPDVVELIQKYRSAANRETKLEVVGQLTKRGRFGYTVLKRLAYQEPNEEDRHSVVQAMSRDSQKLAPELLLAGDLETVQELLEMCLVGSEEEAAANYAVFQLLRGRLKEAIDRFEREKALHSVKLPATKPVNQPNKPDPEPENPNAPVEKTDASELAARRAAEVLTFLYRAQGNLDAALKQAEFTSKPELVEAVLWERNDWARLAKEQVAIPRFRGTWLGLQAAYERLSGDTKAFHKTLATIREELDNPETDRAETRALAEAMLLNGQATEALASLQKRSSNLAFTFNLLCAQNRYRDAFALADANRNIDDASERRELDLYRARALHLLGERDRSAQLFTKLTEDLKEPADVELARDLIRVQTRLGLRERAYETLAHFLDILDQAEGGDQATRVLEPLFPSRDQSAAEWWRFLQKAKDASKPIERMKRLRILLLGPVVKDAQPPAEIAALAKVPKKTAAMCLALADATRIHGTPQQVEDWLRQSAELADTTEGWIRLGDWRSAQQRWPSAAEAYAAALKKNAAQPVAVYLRGWVLSQAGNAKEGKHLMELAHWLPLGSEYLRSQLAEELLKRGFSEAADRERDIILRSGWYKGFYVGNILTQQARQAADRKDYVRAAALYEKALVGCLRTGAMFIEPTAYVGIPAAVPSYRARASLADGKIDEARQQLDDSLKIMPGNVDTALLIIPELDRRGLKKEADALFERLLASHAALCKDYPKAAFAHNSSAWLAAGCRRQLEEALKHATKAVELAPKNSGYLDTLAEVHFRRGDKAKAIELMKQCQQLNPQSLYFRKQLERFEKGDITTPPPPETDDD